MSTFWLIAAVTLLLQTHEGEFYGLRPAEARASAYIIRTLHKDFDPASGGSSSALMQAALGSADLPSGVNEALSSLEMMNDIDGHPALPNGTVFQKTQVKHPRTHQGAHSGATTTSSGTLRSTTAPQQGGASKTGGSFTAGFGDGSQSRRSVNKVASPPGATMQVRPTMIAPRTRVSFTDSTVLSGS